MVIRRVFRSLSLAPRGVALLNALLIVAALSAVTVTLLQRTEAANARLTEMKRAGQAELYLDAVTLQLRDVIGPAQISTDGQTIIVERSQTWAQPARNILIGEGTAAWQVDDLQSRFNLAWLGRNLEVASSGRDSAEEPLDLNAMLRDAFQQIALDRGLTRTQVRRLEQALVPDLGQRVTAYGRATRPPPLPPASLDELLLVDGINADDLARLKPVLSSLPDNGVGLNMNTVSAEVLAALMGESSVETIEARLASDRPFRSEDEATQWVENRAGADATELLDAIGLEVGSTWFESQVELELDTLVLTRRVVMQRTSPDTCCRILSVSPEYP